MRQLDGMVGQALVRVCRAHRQGAEAAGGEPVHVADGADLTLRVATSDGGGEAVFNCRRAGERITVTSDGRATMAAISPDGQTVEHTPMPDLLTTNICFGGDDLRTAFVTLSATGKLVAVDWPRPGLKLNY